MTNTTEQLTLEETINFYDFLQGKPDKRLSGVVSKNTLKLSEDDAFLVLYYLQAPDGVIPDHYEQCSNCKELFDSDCEGMCSESELLCDCCYDAKLMRGESVDEKELS